jgi:hypothetical protein
MPPTTFVPRKPRGPDPAVVLAALKKCESAHRLSVLLAIVSGAILSFVGPLFITGVSWLIAARQRHEFAFWHAYWPIALASMPVLFLIAATVKGSILESAAGDGAFDNWFVSRRIAFWVMLAELANIGPRLVIYAWRKQRARSAVGPVDLHRAAAAVAALAVVEGGVGPAKLLQSNEPADVLEPLLAFLMYYDIADVSKTGDRVWLNSGAKQRLLSAG